MSTKSFDNLALFALHLAEAAVAVRAFELHALDRAAKLVETAAKAEFGTYQPEVGPFAAWAPLADATVADRVRQGFTPDEPLLRTGALRDSISRQVSGNEALIGSTSDVMLYQELGTSKIPPRPVLGPAAFSNQKAVQALLGESLMHAIEYGASGGFTDLPE